jgi:hypothetical protein
VRHCRSQTILPSCGTGRCTAQTSRHHTTCYSKFPRCCWCCCEFLDW